MFGEKIVPEGQNNKVASVEVKMWSDSKDTSDRRKAAQLAVECGGSGLHILGEMAQKETDPTVLSDVIDSLKKMRGHLTSESYSIMQGLTRHPDAQVRFGAIEGLGTFFDDGNYKEQAKRILIEKMNDEQEDDPLVRCAAIQTLRNLGPEVFTDLVNRLEFEQEDDPRSSLVAAMVDMGEEGIAILQQIVDGKRSVNLYAESIAKNYFHRQQS